MSNCNCHTSPNRDGSGRLQRYLTALDPAYAKIDGRSTEELLVFIKKYAAQIRFYDIPGSTGDDTPEDITQLSWSEFFRRDFAVIAASMMLTDAAAFKTEYDENREDLEMSPSPHHFGNLFDPIIGMASKLDSWLTLAIPGHPLHDDLQRMIQSGLKPAMKKILAYEDAFRLIDSKHPLKLDYTPIKNDDIWGLNDEVIPDSTIYTGASIENKMLSAMLYVDDVFNTFYGIFSSIVEDADKYMQYAMEQYPKHQPHMALFLSFLQLFAIAQEQMNGITGRMLNFYYRDVLHLEEKPSIPDRVHIIFELAKDIFQYDVAQGTSLNGGMDNSGKKVAYNTNTDIVVNQAKVKELKTIFVQKGIIGDAGTRTMVPSIDTFYARPIANSADGFGEKITDPGGKWSTFGKGTPDVSGKLDVRNPCTFIEKAKELASRKDQAQIGFAISSPQLLLLGGKRIIQVHIDSLTELVGTITAETAGAKSPFQIYLTGEKGWIDAGKLITKAEYDALTAWLPFRLIYPFIKIEEAVHYIDRENSCVFIFLPVAAEPVVKFDAKTHKGYDIKAKHPVLRIMLNTDLKVSESVYASIDFTDIRLETQVGSIYPDPDLDVNGLKAAGAGIKDLKAKAMLKTVTLPNVRFLFMDGLRTFALQNDETALTAGKPFDPFTAYPLPGKAFYIGSEEVFNKPLGRLGVNILKTQDKAIFYDTWGVLPLKDAGSTSALEYGASILEGRTWVELTPYTNHTGEFTQTELTHNILYNRIPDDLEDNDGDPATPVSREADPHPHPRLPLAENATQFSPQSSSKGFLRITNVTPINPGNLSTMQISQNMAAAMQVKDVSVNYYSDLSPLEAGTDQFFHIYPFGAAETYINAPGEANQTDGGKDVVAVTSSNNPLRIRLDRKFDAADKANDYLLVQANNKLLPQFTWKSGYDDYNTQTATTQPAAEATPGNYAIIKKDSGSKEAFNYESVIAYGAGIRSLQPGKNQYSGLLQEEGMLFIGLEKLQPLQTISMLFQFADGSAEDEDQDPPEIRWSYLTNNEWRPMNGENLVSDGTYGFQTTGIIKIDVPADATTNNTIITNGLIWFMASVEKNSHRIPMLIDVVTQAVEATFTDNDNDQTHFDEALPAGTIGKLSVAVAEVSKVAQPFASFDGKHKETGKEYYVRVSERLRHKGRAINAWDYEHLVLERFPSIYKVKALNHTDPECLCRNTKGEAVATPPPLVGNATATLEMEYNSDGNFSEADMKAFDQVLIKMTVANVTSVSIKASFVATHEAPMAESVQLKIKGQIAGKGVATGLITAEQPAMGASHKIAIAITEKNTSGKSATGPVLVTTYNLGYARTGDLDAASQAKVLTALNQLKNDPTFIGDVQIFYNTDIPQTVAQTVVKKITDQFAADGVTAARFKGNALIGVSRTGILNVYKPGEVTPPVSVPVETKVCCGPQIAPGHVLIIPIADLKNRNAVNPLQPKTGRRTLLEIEAYLKKRTSPFVQVHAKNPVYEQIMVAFRVKFYTGTDKGYYLKKLNKEIVHFLTPWAFDDAAEVKFGAEVYSSSIINFIEERPYVDFITDFFMFVCRDECCPPEKVRVISATPDVKEYAKDGEGDHDGETPAEILSRFCNCKSFEELLQSDFPGLVVARPATARSILVSVPQHIIVPYVEPPYESPCEKRKKLKDVPQEVKPAEAAPKPAAPVNPTPATPAPATPVATPARPEEPVNESVPEEKKATPAKVEKKTTPAVKKAAPKEAKKNTKKP